MRSRFHRSEDGAVAVMYSILMLVFIGFVALVLDIGAMRADRRNTQLLADSAATSGVTSLITGIGGSPMEACNTAWEYFLLNAPEIDPNGAWDNPCDGTADGGPSIDSWTCETAPPYNPANDTGPWVVEHAGDYEVVIMWPVPGEIIAGDGYDDELDGDPCERLGVWVRRTRGFIFGGIFAEGGRIGAPAVARYSTGESTKAVASLVLLDPTACVALEGSGGGAVGGGVWVWEGEDGFPGIINVDSDGSECGGYVLDVGGNGAGRPAELKAGVESVSGSDGIVGGSGIIIVHAIGAGECVGCGYDPGDVPLQVEPEPIDGPPVTRLPAEHRWNCKDDYPVAEDPVPHHPVPPCEGDENVPANSAYIDNLESYVNAITDATAATAAGYQVITDCSPTGTQNWTLQGSETGFWVDCPGGLNVRGTVNVPEGNVILTGGLSVANNAAFRLNAATAGGCSTKGADPDDPSDDVSHDNWLIIRGPLGRGTHSQLEFGRVDCRGTSVLMLNGRIDFAGGGSGALRWIGPYVPSMERGPHFDLEDLSLWSESTALHVLRGDVSDLQIEGVFYIPNADDGAGFEYAGNGAMGQQKAQFLTYRMWAHGNGKLQMTPDPERTLKTTVIQSISLIR